MVFNDDYAYRLQDFIKYHNLKSPFQKKRYCYNCDTEVTAINGGYKCIHCGYESEEWENMEEDK